MLHRKFDELKQKIYIFHLSIKFLTKFIKFLERKKKTLKPNYTLSQKFY